MRKAAAKPERKSARPSITTCCARCATRLEVHYSIVEKHEDPVAGQCPICFGNCYLGRYAIMPKVKSYRKRTGGGERARAGGT